MGRGGGEWERGGREGRGEERRGTERKKKEGIKARRVDLIERL